MTKTVRVGGVRRPVVWTRPSVQSSAEIEAVALADG